MTEAESASWGEYRRKILADLDRIAGDVKGLNEKLDRFRQEDIAKMQADLAVLKFQAGVWGAVGGVVSVVGVLLIGMLK